jgi:hypothetical protein
VPSVPIEERLLHYFLAMGAQLSEPLENVPPGLTIGLGSEKIHVAILNSDAFLQRGKIIESIMCLASLRGSVNQLYLAAPRLLGTTVDAEVFRSHGIGLLLFDDRRIDETVAPQSFHHETADPREQRLDPSLEAEVATLKSMYLEMEKTVARLREDIKNYQETMGPPLTSSETLSSPPAFDQQRKFARPEVGLPSFFVNNPWLEVLSKRGREETAPIAG